MQWETKTIQDFEQVTKEILAIISEQYQQNKTGTACIVCLQGDLGAGKTTMTQIIAKELGVSENLQSPTFVIKKIYPTASTIFSRLVHVDAYRLGSEDNINLFRFAEDFKSPGTLMMIEWPEMISEHIPDSARYIHIHHTKDGRVISLNKKTD